MLNQVQHDIMNSNILLQLIMRQGRYLCRLYEDCRLCPWLAMVQTVSFPGPSLSTPVLIDNRFAVYRPIVSHSYYFLVDGRCGCSRYAMQSRSSCYCIVYDNIINHTQPLRRYCLYTLFTVLDYVLLTIYFTPVVPDVHSMPLFALFTITLLIGQGCLYFVLTLCRSL